MLLKTALFTHIVSTATLLGGLSLIVMFLRDTTKSSNIETMTYAAKKVQHWNRAMMVPVAGLAFVSGIYMMFQYTQKPIWLVLKERLGSLFLFLFIMFIITYGKKLVMKIEAQTNLETVQSLINRYIRILNFAILYMIALIFIVSFKF